MGTVADNEQINANLKTPPPLIHNYPRDPRYRLSGMDKPQIGDIARCGWRKKVPHQAECSGVTCVVCWDLCKH